MRNRGKIWHQCGKFLCANALIRVLKTTEDQVILDATGRKNGRGAYLCFNKECLKKAVKNKGLERSLKMEIPQTIYENLEKEFEELENT